MPNLSPLGDAVANLTHVKRVVVSLGSGVRIDMARVFPRLGKGTIVPDVAVVREAIVDVAKLALFDVLLDRV